MRIQHNIMAMSAYRNYNTNTSAVAKNLEKLSSGYKINRAGDDAAGLAISEKMRAQITGLNAAQKNVKDGISLVKTAEGAMQEIQDMLNRMDYLATQSANGTYDNEVDRAALQKEVNQLLDEIDRIAASANFNGIQLLDGKWDAGGSTRTGEFIIPEVGAPLGDQTYIHGAGTEKAKTEFEIHLDSLEINPTEDGAELEVQIGDGAAKGAKVTLTLNKDEKYDAAKLAAAIAAKFNETDGTTNKVAGQEFTITADGGVVKFVQKNDPTGETDTVDGSMDVKLSYKANAADAAKPLNDGIALHDINPLVDEVKAPAVQTTTGTAATEAQEGTKATATFDFMPTLNSIDSAVTDENEAGGSVELLGTTYSWGTEDPAGDNSEHLSQTSKADIISTLKSKVQGKIGSLTVPSGWGNLVSSSTDGNYTATLTATAVGKKTEAPVMGGVTGTITNAGSDAVDADPGSKSKVEVDFANLTGKDVIGDTVKIGSKTFEFVKDAADVTDGNTAIVVAEDDAAAALATKFETEVKKATESGIDFANAVANGTKVTIQASAVGNTEITAAAKDAGGGSEDDDKPTAVNKEIFSQGDGIDVAADGDKTLDQLAAVKAVLTGLSDIKVGEGAGEVDVELSKLSFEDTDTLKGALKKVSDAIDTAVKAWNTANAKEKGYSYEYKGLSTDGTEAGKIDLQAATGVTALIDMVPNKQDDDNAAAAGGVSGTYNAATVMIKQGAAEKSGTMASTKFELTDAFKSGIGDGSTVTIAGKDYTFKLSDKFEVNGTTITLDKNGDLIEQAGDGLSQMTNDTFSIGHEGGGKIVINELKGNTNNLDKLTSREGIQSLLGFKSVTAKDDSKGLTLQIGDTSKNYNQLKVSIGSMKTEDLGIKGLNIGTAASAAESIDIIKNAINTVSGVRGDLGAYQNRLEHTANNLSVMAENIQDAESSIRDTDIAEEMMSYTKNNILVQSAQAMLAQANQVPQGVLQLLG